MKKILFAFLLINLLAAPAFSQSNNPGVYSKTTSGALEPPTGKDSTKITKNNFSLVANTVYTIPANANRIGIQFQCLGTSAVEIDETGANITAISTATTVGSGTITLPGSSGNAFSPVITSKTAITLLTSTGQTCHGTEYNR